MTGYYLSIAFPIAYLLTGLVVAGLAASGVRRAMRIDLDRSDTDELVMASIFTVIIGMVWPMSLLVWLFLPRDPRTGKRFPA